MTRQAQLTPRTEFGAWSFFMSQMLTTDGTQGTPAAVFVDIETALAKQTSQSGDPIRFQTAMLKLAYLRRDVLSVPPQNISG